MVLSTRHPRAKSGESSMHELDPRMPNTDKKQAGEMSAAKRALLAIRLQQGATTSLNSDQISPRESTGPVEMSFAQELLWLLDQLNPNLSVYSVPRAMRI